MKPSTVLALIATTLISPFSVSVSAAPTTSSSLPPRDDEHAAVEKLFSLDPDANTDPSAPSSCILANNPHLAPKAHLSSLCQPQGQNTWTFATSHQFIAGESELDSGSFRFYLFDHECALRFSSRQRRDCAAPWAIEQTPGVRGAIDVYEIKDGGSDDADAATTVDFGYGNKVYSTAEGDCVCASVLIKGQAQRNDCRCAFVLDE